jgi:hypothetical protein
MIGFIGSSITITQTITVRNQWLPKTYSIPHWAMSVFSSTVMNEEFLATES